MRVRRLALLGAAVLAAGCGRPVPPAPPGLDLGRLLPDASSLSGFRAVEGPEEYPPERLYEVLDGGAERYLGYGCARMLRVRYEAEGRAGAGVTISLFDMGGDLGAFGIYSSSRPPGGTLERWGVEGYRTGPVAAAWKGRLFAHAQADDEREELLGLSVRLLASACERVEGSAAPPAILSVLPPDGLVPRSERWIAADLLGHACLPGGLLATYSRDDGRGELFASELGSRRKAAQALAALRRHYERSGPAEAAPSIGAEAFTFRDPTLGEGTAVAHGRFVAGVHGTLSREARARLLAQLLARFPAR